MEIQDVIDNVMGKNDVGVIEWVCSAWALLTLLLIIPFLILMWVCVVLPMLFVSESTKATISLSDYIKNNLSRNSPSDTKPKIQPMNEPNLSSTTPRPFILPFTLKNIPDYTLTIGIKSNQMASSFITLIKKITVGYLKSMAEDGGDFIFAHINEPTFDNDQLTTDKVYAIGRFIHDYVWHTMTENTSISNNHRLIYGTKYTPFLLKVTNNFHPDKSVQGVQIYVESLIDYYVDIVISDDEPITTNTQAKQEVPTNNRQSPRVEKENDNKKEKEKSSIWTIIGVCFMGFITLGGVIKDYFNSYSKETVIDKAPDLAIQPLPNTGDTDNPNFYGNNPLTIKTQSGKNYLVKISNSVNDMTMASYFIRGGDTLNIKVPTGSYTIKYASGIVWYGTTHLFGKETQYTKADEVFEFNNNGYTIELIYQTNGNLHTKGLDANQF